MSNYTLTYRKGKSQEIYIEEIGDSKDQNELLYFKQEYDDAIRLIKEIIILQGIGADDDKEDDNKNGKNENGKKNKRDIKKYGCNNRILFAGQRGCGKTSVMQSLAEYLSKHKIKIEKKDDEEDDDKIKCYCLPMVDPSHFDNNNNILLTVITSMFSEAKKKMETNSDKDESAEREDLLKQFEKVFKSLDSIKSELSSYTLESLNRKSDAEDLRDKMNNLVSKFLKYVVGNKEARLVLLIDDIDMSVSYAPEMLEQLRKYLELDNLIILMSANLGQLSNEMREKYSSAFQYTLKDSNQALSIDVEDLATKYLLKLFPTSRRINVERHVEQLLKTNLKITNENGVLIKGSDSNDEGDKGDFQNVILSLIWEKTRLLFTLKDQDHTLHPIIPSNLRDLSQFLDVLVSLEPINYSTESRLFEDTDAYDRCVENNRAFKNYFMNTWIPNHLNVEEELVFRNIPTDITEINKHLINSINIIGTKHKDNLMSREVGLDIIERNADNVFIDRDIYTMVSPNDPKFVKANKISDIFNQPSNYSYGDLLLMIDKYETYFESEEHRKFTDAIKIYYSILLFETMFFESTNVRFKKDDYNKLKEEDRVLPIQKLIGGTVYYPNYFEIIKDKYFNQKGPSFDAKRAFYHKLLVESGKKVGENYPFFAVLYYGDIRPDRYDTKHIYDTTFENDAHIDENDFVTFDILSILSNMLNPWHTYFRAGDDYIDNSDNWKIKIEGNPRSAEQSEKEGWRDFCEIKSTTGEGSKYIPNSILPFYSVDMMLNYLKESFDASKIIANNGYAKDDYKRYDDFKVKGRKLLYASAESSENSEKGLINCLEDLRKTLVKSFFVSLLDQMLQSLRLSSDNVSLIEEMKKELKSLNKNDNNCFNKLKDTIESIPDGRGRKIKEFKTRIIAECDLFGQEDTPKSIDELREQKVPDEYQKHYLMCIDILENAIKIKENLNKIPNKESLAVHFKDATNYYLNEAISILLEKYTESQKERDNLIKELHKYSTPSEIFKHLVESLWDNKMTEICIRSDIQAKVRNEKSVDNYYIRLWEKTKGLLDIADDNAIPIYRDIFNKAAKTFITKDHVNVMA